MAGKVYFIGAGPGDPELLTIRAKNIIERADVIIYADSLINSDVCSSTREGTEIYPSVSLSLEKITSIILDAVKQGKVVARLQSGDPSIYGAVHEQMAVLDEKGIEYEIIPGVSSLFAAVAALKTELTIPELSQTVIITRMEGRTPVPALESLKRLAQHQSTMAIFLSISLISEVVSALLEGGYSADTPVAVVYRASWKDEVILRASLTSLVERVQTSGIRRQALILVGGFLNSREKPVRSKLYDRDFKHEYR
jgi:precorrin-4/cobalt-precorrin-4 C11-methyltransferase